LTISAGVQTLIPSDELSIEKLIRTADQALYEAKKEHNEVVGI
jgi:PleD family two-component response regulator